MNIETHGKRDFLSELCLAKLNKMSAYTSLLEILYRYGLPVETIDELGREAAFEAFKATDALIDGELAKRYDLPLNSPELTVGYLALPIAAYKLGLHRKKKQIEKDFLNSIVMLRHFSEGTIRLVCDEYKYDVPIDPAAFMRLGRSQ